jgi:hypothetical protein
LFVQVINKLLETDLKSFLTVLKIYSYNIMFSFVNMWHMLVVLFSGIFRQF